jgi:hypothetical protein
MAKKSSGSVKKEAPTAAAKAPAKKAAPKKKAAAQTAAKTATPKKASAPKGAAPKKAAATPAATPAAKAPVKKAAPLKLTDKQTEILKRVKDSGETGYTSGAKIEDRTLEALKEKKLLKRGAKNKETGNHHYTLTKTGEKHLAPSSTGA